MDLGFTTEGIIKIFKEETFDDISTSEPIDELTSLICKVGACVMHKSSEEVYEAFKSVVKQIGEDTYQSVKDRYGIKTDDESEVLNHPEIGSIKREVDKTDLFWSHGFTETKVGHIPLEGRYTSEEISAISDMYELTESLPIIFIRKTDKNESIISYLMFDDEKKSLTTFDMHLKFHLLDDANPKKKLLMDILKNMLKGLDYDSLIKTEAKNRSCSPSMITGLIKLIGMICFVHLTFSYFIK
jgi:hypothetical protein